jgi:TM2 domain-containing membrane protein YozV
MNKKHSLPTYLLWFFLGFFGIHKFYLGKTAWGLIYFFTGGLFFFGWLIDFFTIPFQVREYNRRLLAFRCGPPPRIA